MMFETRSVSAKKGIALPIEKIFYIAIAVLGIVILGTLLFISGKPAQTQKTYEACVFYDAKSVATPFVYDTSNKTQADAYFKIAFAFKPTGILCTAFNVTGSNYKVDILPPDVLYNITKPLVTANITVA